MIWQTLSMIIGGMVARNELPETLDLLKQQVITTATTILDYPEQEIYDVLHSTDCTEFARILTKLDFAKSK